MHAPVHTALSVQQFLTKTSMTLIHLTPYSPDLAQATFSLFPRMKKVLKGKHFANVEEVKQTTTEALKSIKINDNKNCFEQWKKMSQ